MKLLQYILIGALLLPLACTDSPAEKPKQEPVNEVSWQQEFIDQKLNVVGTEIDKKIKEQKYLIVDSDSLEHYYYKAVAYKDQGFAGSMDIDFFFSSDTLCKQGYRDFKKSFDEKFGESSPSETMASWEAPSSRNKVVTVVLVDRSTFFQQPRLQIKLKENDNRTFRN